MREGGDAHRGGGGECGRNECRILLTCGVDVRCGVLALSWSWGGGGSGAYFLWWWDWVVSRFCLSLKITNCFHLRFVTFKIFENRLWFFNPIGKNKRVLSPRRHWVVVQVLVRFFWTPKNWTKSIFSRFEKREYRKLQRVLWVLNLLHIFNVRESTDVCHVVMYVVFVRFVHTLYYFIQ